MSKVDDYPEGSELELSLLFPKCRSRSNPSSPNNSPSGPAFTQSSQNLPYSHLVYAQNETNSNLRNSQRNYIDSSQFITNNDYYNSTNFYQLTNRQKNSPHKLTNTGIVNNLNCLTVSDANDNFQEQLEDSPTHFKDDLIRMHDSSISNSSNNSITGCGSSNSSSRMSVDTASSNFSPEVRIKKSTGGSNSVDSSVNGANSEQINCIQKLNYQHSPNEDDLVIFDDPATYEDINEALERNQEIFKQRDSRIELAGGREIYSESKSRMYRNRNNRTNDDLSRVSNTYNRYNSGNQHVIQISNSNMTPNSVMKQQNRSNNYKSYDEECLTKRTNLNNQTDCYSSMVYKSQFPPSECLFDNIDDDESGLTVRDMNDSVNESSTTTSGPDSDESFDDESPVRVTKIGSVPIADYEGSPRRYGNRSITRSYSPRKSSHKPRPGFPRRVLGDYEDRKCLDTDIAKCSNDQPPTVASVEKAIDGQVIKPNKISISTLSSVYGVTGISNNAVLKTSTEDDSINRICDNEINQDKKVLKEFSRFSDNSTNDFSDIDYYLKRQHGNSYVGQRLANEYVDGSFEQKLVLSSNDGNTKIESIELEKYLSENYDVNFLKENYEHENDDQCKYVKVSEVSSGLINSSVPQICDKSPFTIASVPLDTDVHSHNNYTHHEAHDCFSHASCKCNVSQNRLVYVQSSSAESHIAPIYCVCTSDHCNVVSKAIDLNFPQHSVVKSEMEIFSGDRLIDIQLKDLAATTSRISDLIEISVSKEENFSENNDDDGVLFDDGYIVELDEEEEELKKITDETDSDSENEGGINFGNKLEENNDISNIGIGYPALEEENSIVPMIVPSIQTSSTFPDGHNDGISCINSTALKTNFKNTSDHDVIKSIDTIGPEQNDHPDSPLLISNKTTVNESNFDKLEKNIDSSTQLNDENMKCKNRLGEKLCKELSCHMEEKSIKPDHNMTGMVESRKFKPIDRILEVDPFYLLQVFLSDDPCINKVNFTFS